MFWEVGLSYRVFYFENLADFKDLEGVGLKTSSNNQANSNF